MTRSTTTPNYTCAHGKPNCCLGLGFHGCATHLKQYKQSSLVSTHLSHCIYLKYTELGQRSLGYRVSSLVTSHVAHGLCPHSNLERVAGTLESSIDAQLAAQARPGGPSGVVEWAAGSLPH